VSYCFSTILKKDELVNGKGTNNSHVKQRHCLNNAPGDAVSIIGIYDNFSGVFIPTLMISGVE